MILVGLLLLVTLLLAYANGANDNFKGVATLFGSGTTDYRKALTWATLTTFAGSLSSVFLASLLLKRFSGKGLVPDSLAASPEFLFAVGLGAGVTVLLATLTGLPISTTHSLTGALVGAGLMATGGQVHLGVLGSAFLLPLLVSPALAAGFSTLGYRGLRALRIRLGIDKETCLCVGKTAPPAVIQIGQSSVAVGAADVSAPAIKVGSVQQCQTYYTGTVLGIRSQMALDTAHYASAGMVSFARGLNDTPKIVALLLVVQGLPLSRGMLLVGLAMAVGGWLNARKVALTMSERITPLNPGQGFTANLVTGLLVIVASRLGVPVSTTHVSVGSLFGIGLATGEGNRRMIRNILLAWAVTLPVAALLSALIWLAVG